MNINICKTPYPSSGMQELHIPLTCVSSTWTVLGLGFTRVNNPNPRRRNYSC